MSTSTSPTGQHAPVTTSAPCCRPARRHTLIARRASQAPVMERPSFVSRSSSSLSSFLSVDEKPLLPHPAHQKSRFRIRTLLGHCLYRRVILWCAAAIVLLCFALSSRKSGLRRQRLIDLTRLPDLDDGTDIDSEAGNVIVVPAGSNPVQLPSWREDLPTWLRFRQ
jgi:hypothetical protein